jgi:eukaryotic-like serine/threonine-protein kinase
MDGSKTRINEVCVRFEADWQAGLHPRIEAHLPAESSHSERDGLLRELIRLEVALLADDGSPARREEYDARFPDDPGAVAGGFRTGPEEAASAFPSLGSGALADSFREALASEEFDGRSAEAGPRFTKRRDHARGGLGVVEVWFDHELNREVAVKRIHEHKADDPASRARFLQEGEITGNLEHPGIVPVYARGRDADGRPYYVMRFVRGESLKDAIAAFHGREALADRGTRDLALRKLLSRLLDVCNAIEYAHSKGILHRDLKPSNVMLGPYGETLVVDWGLAKVLSRPENGDSATEPARGPSSWAETAAGIAMGTPAYMSPEQAEGDLAGLGPASDVYSLGATLYAILTSRSPIPGGPTGERLAMARRGEFPRPRAVVPWIDRALEAVCLKAMQHRPKDRYPSCRAMTDDIERWLADEPVSAWREPFPRRASRFLKRHRTSATAAAVAIALIGGGLIWSSREIRRREDTALGILDKARIAWRTGDLGAAVELVAQADKFRPTFGGNAALKQQIVADGHRYRMLKALDDARVAGSDFHGDSFDRENQREGYAQAFRDYRINLLGSQAEIERGLRSSDIAPALASALLEWAILDPDHDHREWLVGLARITEPTREIEPLRQVIAQLDAATLADLATKIDSSSIAPSLLAELSRFLVLRQRPEAAVALIASAREKNPADFWLNYALAVAYANLKTPQAAQAERYLTAAQSLRPRSPAVYSGLGVIRAKQGRTDEAIEAYDKAIAIEPDYASAHDNRGSALLSKRDYSGAVAAYEKAVKCKPTSAEMHLHLGIAQEQLGQQEDVEAAVKDAIRLGPDKPEIRASLVHPAMEGPSNSHEKAFISFHTALAINPHYAEAYVELGQVLRERGEYGLAIGAFVRAILVKPNLGSAYRGLGEALAAEAQILVRPAARQWPGG